MLLDGGDVLKYPVSPSHGRLSLVPGWMILRPTALVRQADTFHPRCRSQLEVQALQVRVQILVVEASDPVRGNEAAKNLVVLRAHDGKGGKAGKGRVVEPRAAESAGHAQVLVQMAKAAINGSVVKGTVHRHVVAQQYHPRCALLPRLVCHGVPNVADGKRGVCAVCDWWGIVDYVQPPLNTRPVALLELFREGCNVRRVHFIVINGNDEEVLAQRVLFQLQEELVDPVSAFWIRNAQSQKNSLNGQWRRSVLDTRCFNRTSNGDFIHPQNWRKGSRP